MASNATHKVNTDHAPSARDILYAEYGDSKNFMTPSILKCGKAGKWRAWELSVGSGIFSAHIFGVSVVDVNPETGETDRHNDAGAAFQTRAEADSYIERLRADAYGTKCDECRVLIDFEDDDAGGCGRETLCGPCFRGDDTD